MAAKASKSRRVVVPMPVGGMFTSGDPSSIPDGHCLSVRNMVLRPNGMGPRLDARPQFTYDGVAGGLVGFLQWEDLTNQQTRLMLMTNQLLRLKSTSDETYSTVGTWTPNTVALIDYTNYRGKVFFASGLGLTTPSTLRSYDGTTSASPLGATAGSVNPRGLRVFKDRLFLVRPAVSLNNFAGLTNAYDMSGWTLTNVTVTQIANGTTVTGRIVPTSTTNASARSPVFTLTTENVIDLIAYVRGVSSTYSVPLTVQVVAGRVAARVTAYGLNDIVIPTGGANGYRYRCTVAGTTAAGAIVWPTTVGATVADGTVTWQNDGSDALLSVETYVPNATDSSQFTALTGFTQIVNGGVLALGVALVFKFGNSTSTTWDLAPVEYSYKDGLTDGNPAKANKGFQVMCASFVWPWPFFNQESFATAQFDMPDDLYYSEVAAPTTFLRQNTYRLTDQAGVITTLKQVGERLVVFKRNSFTTFFVTEDADIPIRADRTYVSIGCIHPSAFASLDDLAVFVGENEVYEWRVGTDPQPLCGEAMREAIMNKAASSWVESQTTYNRPLVAISAKDREVYVYTQRGIIYVYNLNYKMWTYFEASGGTDIASIAWNATKQKLYVAWSGATTRLDDTQSPAQDAVAAGGTPTVAVTKEIALKPSEVFSPREDILIDSIGVFHLATASQASNTLTAYVSYDRGATYPYSDQVTLDLTIPRNQIDLFETAPSLTLKLSHVGYGGKSVWSVTKCDAVLIVKGAEWPQVRPTPVSANL